MGEKLQAVGKIRDKEETKEARTIQEADEESWRN